MTQDLSRRQPNDTVTVHHNVLLTIAQEAALSVKGVARLGYASGALDRLLGLDPSENGLNLEVKEDAVTLEIFLVVDARYNLRETCVQVQQEVSRTMQQYVGMAVQAVNVHIEDIIFGASSPA